MFIANEVKEELDRIITLESARHDLRELYLSDKMKIKHHLRSMEFTKDSWIQVMKWHISCHRLGIEPSLFVESILEDHGELLQENPNSSFTARDLDTLVYELFNILKPYNHLLNGLGA